MRAILTYHSIDDSGSPVSVSPSVFAAQAKWLASGAVRVLSLEALLADRRGGDAVAVTFDDGFLNARGPIERLRAEGLPVAVFVVSGHVGETNAWGGRPYPGIPTLPLLSWADLGALVGRGVTIGAHTRTHRPLTGLSAAEIDAETLGCREDISARLGVHSMHFAYPYGKVDDAVVERTRRHFQWGVTTDFRLLSDVEEPMRLPRLEMFYFNRAAGLEAWGTPAFGRRLAWYRARRRLRGR